MHTQDHTPSRATNAGLSPTNASRPIASEFERWRRVFAGPEYHYGDEPGPLARRTVRYHQTVAVGRGPFTALDAGCGEGQDLAFLAGCGYRTTGVEFTPEGAAKSRRLLEERGQHATVLEQDLRTFIGATAFDLVLCSNVLPFLGGDAPACLLRLRDGVAPGGIIGISLFGREPGQPAVAGTVYFATLPELLALFSDWQPLEATRLWQWNLQTGQPQPFVTLIARRSPPLAPLLADL